MDDIPLTTQILLLVILLAISAFFSISETSMMALNRYKLRHLAKQGNRSARLTMELLAKMDRLLGVILLGNTLVNTAAATLAGLIVLHEFGEDKWTQLIGAMTIGFFILVFAEITPKVIGATYPERIALSASYILKPLSKLLYPAIWFCNLFVLTLLKSFKLTPGSIHQTSRLSVEELRALVLEAENLIPKKHQSILVNLFDLERTTVEDVMTPRAQIEAIDIDSPIEEIAHQISTSYHTRLPVYRGEMNNAFGVIHLRKVLGLLQNNTLTKEAFVDLVTEAYFIPASTPLLTQLQFFQENRQRFALAVDEYGVIQGLVTLEDILEEIIGEYTTSMPSSSSDYNWDKDHSVIVEGSSLLRELNRKLGLQLPLGGPKTINGLILEHLQDIPEAGVSLKIASYPIEILQTQNRVIKTVKIFKPKLEKAVN